MTMKRVLAGITAATAIAVLLAAGAVWNEYLRAPPVALQQLPTGLVSLDSPAGRRLLATSKAKADFDELAANFVPQSRKAYCGVASAVTTLNAAEVAHAPLDRRALFDNPSVDLHPLKVSFVGMSLREFGNLLRAHGAKTTVVHASATDLHTFRRIARSNLGRDGDFLLINYERQHIGQEPSGHISPIAAYHEQSDRLLILDVAAHRYPPVWAPLEDVWKAMEAPISAEIPVTRGFVVVQEAARNSDSLTALDNCRQSHREPAATESG